ncbi:hypothetical protein GGS21DRAFT_134909 [Xylaria nigripes]|nr:hypothetical protein GGS21DRAFT_134909 [Xylaria nigripes]
MRKWMKPKVNFDYRDRWPTQQTLVESHVSQENSHCRRRWKFRLRSSWLRCPKLRPSQEPGQSTHPYDTGVDERACDSRSSSGPTCEDGDGGDQICPFFGLIRGIRSPLSLISKLPHFREDLQSEMRRPETPKTPIQLLRPSTSYRKSPFPRPRTISPLNIDTGAATI